MTMKIGRKSTLLFIGDSITSSARDFSQNGEGNDAAFGDGYVRIIKSMLDAFYTERDIRVINMGVGGHTIRDLAARWQSDVIDRQPDWLSIMIGINDVWRQFDAPLRPEKHVPPDEFKATYRQLLDSVRESLPGLHGLVIASPYVISPPDDPMRRRMDEYAGIAREIAEAYDAIYVDTQAPFDTYLKHRHPNDLCWDRIHPRNAGHMLIAHAWLSQLGFSWS